MGACDMLHPAWIGGALVFLLMGNVWAGACAAQLHGPERERLRVLGMLLDDRGVGAFR